MASPFKDKKLLIHSISQFLSRHESFMENQGDRISDYFEMSCFNDVVSFYKASGFQVKPMNLVGGEFIYKLKPSGHAENFSYFEINGKGDYEVHHNLSIESKIGDAVFYTPDVSVVLKDSIVKGKIPSYYDGKRAHSYCSSGNLQTFVEAKHMNPFPELLFNFTGLLLSFMPQVLTKGSVTGRGAKHLAPTLALSGNGNTHCHAIKKVIEQKYDTNIILGLFYKHSQLYSKTYAKTRIF